MSAESDLNALLQLRRGELAAMIVRSRERRTRLFAGMSEAYVEFDRGFRFADLNSAAVKHLGRTRARIIGECLWDEFPGILGTRFETEYRHAMESGKPVIFEEFYAPFEQWLEIRVYPFEGGIEVFYRDVTDRKRLEDPVLRNNVLLEQSYDAIFAWSPEGGIVTWNSNAERLYGYSSAEAIGRDARGLLRTEYPTTYDRFVGELLKRGKWEGELIQQTKSGERVIVEGRLSVIRRGTERPVVFETAHDVTERRRLESKLATASKMALIGELAAGLAHEIKNPLAGIKGVVDILAERRRREGSGEAEVLENVRHEIERIDRTVRMLLQNSRPRALEMRIGPIDDTIRRAVKIASYQFNTGPDPVGIRLKLPERHVFIDHDEAAVEDAVLNLLLNAGDALKGRRDGVIEVGLEEDPKAVRIVVGDNGRGIPRENVGEIFQPFKTTKSDGTGLGLTAVKRIARAHGGECSVESVPGDGAVFTITLPR